MTNEYIDRVLKRLPELNLTKFISKTKGKTLGRYYGGFSDLDKMCYPYRPNIGRRRRKSFFGIIRLIGKPRAKKSSEWVVAIKRLRASLTDEKERAFAKV